MKHPVPRRALSILCMNMSELRAILYITVPRTQQHRFNVNVLSGIVGYQLVCPYMLPGDLTGKVPYLSESSAFWFLAAWPSHHTDRHLVHIWWSPVYLFTSVRHSLKVTYPILPYYGFTWRIDGLTFTLTRSKPTKLLVRAHESNGIGVAYGQRGRWRS